MANMTLDSRAPLPTHSGNNMGGGFRDSIPTTADAQMHQTRPAKLEKETDKDHKKKRNLFGIKR
jgi:hypothetical protein